MTEIINNKQPTFNERRRKGTGFTNTQKIVDANKNNRLGQAVVSNIGKSVDTAQNQINQEYDKFKQEADKSRLFWDDKRDETKQVKGMLNEISSGNIDENKDYKSLTERFRAGNYQGPTELKMGDSVYNNVMNTKNLAQQGNNEYGRQNLLKRTFGNTNKYTQGQNRLDSMLLGKTAQNELSDLSKRAFNVGQSIDKTRNQAKTLAKNYAQDTRDFAKRYNTEVINTQNPIQQEIDNRVANKNYGTSAASLLREAYKNEDGKIYTGLLNRVQDTSPDIDFGRRTYNYDLGQFQDIDANRNLVTKEQELAQLNALANMLGNNQQSFVTVDKNTFGKYNELNNQALAQELAYQQSKFNQQKQIMDNARTGSLGFGNLTGDYVNERNWLNNRSFTKDLYYGPDYRFNHAGFGGVSYNDIDKYARAIKQGLTNYNNEKEKLANYYANPEQYVSDTDYSNLIEKYANGHKNEDLINNLNTEDVNIDRSLLDKVNDNLKYGYRGWGVMEGTTNWHNL